MTEGTRTLGQRRYENTWQRIQQFDNWLPNEIWAAIQIGKSGYERAEEIASDVRALAATVAELERKVERLIGLDKNTNERLAALESPGSAEAAPEPVCQNCGGSKSKGFCGEDKWNDPCRWKDVPAEQSVQEPPALDPVLRILIRESVVRWASTSILAKEVDDITDAVMWTDYNYRNGGDAREGGK